MLQTIRAHFAYYGKAAAHTFWQAALSSILGANIGSMLNVEHLPAISEVQKIATAAVVAGAAAVFSYVKQLVVLEAPGSVPAIEPTDEEPTAAPVTAAPVAVVESNGTAAAG